MRVGVRMAVIMIVIMTGKGKERKKRECAELVGEWVSERISWSTN